MPEIEHLGCRLYYRVDGAESLPPLLLSNSLGSTLDLWSAQIGPFAGRFRTIRYDTRGHGESTAPPGDYPLDLLGGDALAVLDAVGATHAHVCGISLGGLTAMWLALHAPERVTRIVLANTGARIGSQALWDERIRQIRDGGMASIADGILGRWFTPKFAERHPEVVAQFHEGVSSCIEDGYIGCCAALRDANLRKEIKVIRAPTLVITGRSDTSTPPALGELIRERIPSARLVELDSAHLSNVEQASSFTAAVLTFLSTRGHS